MVAKPVKSMAVADLTRKRTQKAEEARFFIRYLPNARGSMVAKPVKSMAVADLTRKRTQKAEEARFFIRYLPNAIVVRSHAQASGARQRRQKTSMFDAGTRGHGDAAIRGIGCWMKSG